MGWHNSFIFGKFCVMEDKVNHPSHYNKGRIETIEFIEDQGFGVGFCRGNALKYISRAGKKDPATEIEDLEKAVWYVRRAIELLKATKENRTPVKPDHMDEKRDEKLYAFPGGILIPPLDNRRIGEVSCGPETARVPHINTEY